VEALRGQLRTETASFLVQSSGFQCAWSSEVRPLRTHFCSSQELRLLNMHGAQALAVRALDSRAGQHERVVEALLQTLSGATVLIPSW